MGWRRGQAYSQDLRDRVLGTGGSARSVAERFGTSVSFVVKARQRVALTGEVSARPQRSHSRRVLEALHGAIAAQVRHAPDITLNELRAWLQERHGVSASMGLMWNTLDRIGLTLKKRRCAPPSRIAPISPKRARHGASFRPA